MLNLVLFAFVTTSFCNNPSGFHHLSWASSISKRHHAAFIDSKNEFSSQRVATSMASAKGGNDLLIDAEAYHDMISVAVDLTNVYSRNGIVTGTFAVVDAVLFFCKLFLLFHMAHQMHPLISTYISSTSATRSVRDIDTNTKRQYLYNIPITPQQPDGLPPFVAPPIELPTKIKARIPSPSGEKIAILVEEGIPSASGGKEESKRHVFEIWTNNGHRLSNRITLPSEKHGQVCTDFAWFGGISWSADESALVYTAEVNKPETSSFFTTPTSSKDESTIVGGQCTLGVGKSEDWGEKYGTTALLALFCLNVETGKIGAVENVPGSPRDISSTEGGYVLGQPVFSPCGKSVVYTGWDAGEGDEMPRRLGAIYCFHRPCKIYSSPVSGLLGELANPIPAFLRKGNDAPFVCITPNDKLARSPRFSKPVEGIAKLAYLCNTKGFDTHGGCMALHVSDWDMSNGSLINDSRKVVVNVVQLPGERPGDEKEVAGIKFPGLFLNQLPIDCFSPDGKLILTTTEWGSVNKVVAISIDDGKVSPVNFNLLSDEGFNESASQQFLCFAVDGGVVVTQSEANRPTVLGYLQPSFPKDGEKIAHTRVLANMPPISSTSFSSLKPDMSFNPGAGYSYHTTIIQPKHGDVKAPVGAVLLLPDNAGKKKLPLIVVPHGGPHTCMSTNYFPSYGFLCKHGGYAILHVNFRGSTGFGQAALESLAGNAGSLDVLDVVAATRAVIDKGIVDPNRVGICGGSHGKESGAYQ